MKPRRVAALVLMTVLALLAMLFLSACATRRKVSRPAPVPVDRVREQFAAQARYRDAAAETLYHQGAVIHSTLTAAELAELRAQQARDKVILYLENTYR